MILNQKFFSAIIIFFLSVLIIGNDLTAQNIHFQVYSSLNRSNYNIVEYSTNDNYLGYGGRVAMGLSFLQIGGEVERAWTNPIFNNLLENRADSFEENYYGGFIRFNLSSLPAHRFGFVAKGGLGYFNSKIFRESTQEPFEKISIDYNDKRMAWHIGLGFSMPFKEKLHWDFTYQFNYSTRPEIVLANDTIQGHRASFHAFQLGLSYNIVVGKAAQKAKNILSQRPW